MDYSDFSVTGLDDLSDDESSCTESSDEGDDDDDCSDDSEYDSGAEEEDALAVGLNASASEKKPPPRGILGSKIPKAGETISVFDKVGQATSAAPQANKIKDISSMPEEGPRSPMATGNKEARKHRRGNRRRVGRTGSRSRGTNSVHRSNSCTRLPDTPGASTTNNATTHAEKRESLFQRQRSRSLGPGGGGLMVTALKKNPLAGQNIRGRDLHDQMNAKNADWATNNPLAKADLYAMLQDPGRAVAGPAAFGAASRSSSARNLTQYLQAKTAGKTLGTGPGMTLHRANAATTSGGDVGPAAQRRKSSNDLMALLGKAKANDRKNSSNDLLAMVGRAKKNNDSNRPASSNDLLAMLGKAKSNNIRNDHSDGRNGTSNANLKTEKRRQSGKDVTALLDLKKFNLSDSRRALLS